MKIAVMGFGTVGSGVVELIEKNRARILKNSRVDALDVKYILDIRDFPDSKFAGLFTKRFEDIESDPEVSIVVETMGGTTFAYDFVKRSLEAGKSVVTSNKELVAKYGYELLQLAQAKNVNFLFEASVGGGIPIIRPINKCLTANEITEVAGILNGTTNYILSKMIHEGTAFEDALRTAQEHGYAERDPSADIDGYDTCRKIAILAALSFGRHVKSEEIETVGIRSVTAADVQYASCAGYSVKLLGVAVRQPNDRVLAWVGPAFIPASSQLAGVEDVFNAILVRGNALGDVVFYGRGAGKFPTASAVVADVIDAAMHNVRRLEYEWSAPCDGYLMPACEATYAFYVRGHADDTTGLESRLHRNIGALRMLTRPDAPPDEIAFITEPLKQEELQERLQAVPELKDPVMLRITDY